MARASKSSGGAKNDVAKSPAGVAKRSSGRERKTRELFNIQVEEKRVRKPTSSSKKSATKKAGSAKKKAAPSKKGAKRRASKRSETPEDDDQEYEVERIVGHRIYDKFYVEYEVKWRNYNKDHNCFLTEYDLRSSPEILAEYKYSVTNKEDTAGEEYVVEKILTHRDIGKTRYYLVQWKDFEDPVSHTEMERHELAQAKDVLFNYESDLLKKKNQASSSTPKNKKSKTSAKKAKKAKAKANGRNAQNHEEEQEQEEENSDEGEAQEETTTEVQETSDEDED